MDNEGLTRVLKTWKTPSAGPALDCLVRESWRRSLPRRWHPPLRIMAAAMLAIIAACIVTVFAIEHSRSTRSPSVTRVVTDEDLSGFVPIQEIHVVIERRKPVP